MASAGLESVVNAPGLRPPPTGLLATATVIEHPSDATSDIGPGGPGDIDEHWLGGIRWVPESAADPSLYDLCAGAASFGGNTRLPVRTARPFAVEVADQCSSWGWTEEDYEGRATRALMAKETIAVEREFEQGLLIPANAHLTDANAPTPDPLLWEPNGATAVTPKTAVALLDEAIGIARIGQGMIHMTPYLFAQYVTPVTGAPAQRYSSPSGNLIVVGNGYQGIGPDGSGGALRRHLFSDGQVVAGALTTLVSRDGDFVAADTGRTVVIPGAGAAGATLTTTLTFVDATHATLADAAAAAIGPNTLFWIVRGGDATHAAQWMYATDLVEVHRADRILLTPGRLGEALDRAHNTVTFRGSRPYAVAWSGLLHAAVKVTTTTS